MPKLKGNYCNAKGCHNRSEQDGNKERHYYRLPAVITHQGEECQRLSAERRRLWLASLNQDFTGKNLANVRVCSDHFVNKKKAALYQKDSPDWVPTVNMSSQQLTDSRKSLAVNARLNVKNMEVESSAQTCDQTDLLKGMSQSDSKQTSVTQGARVLKEAEEPEPQMFYKVDVKRRVSSGMQCPHCRYRCGSRFSFQIHIGSQHPLHCEDVCVGRLGKVVFYQRTAKLFHCHICFFTSKDYAVLFEHLLARHCFTVKKAVQMDKGDDVTNKPSREGGEQDRSPNPEINNEDNKDVPKQCERESSNDDSLKRKRSSASSAEDEDEDVNVSESIQAVNEDQVAAVEQYSEYSSASYYDCKFCKQRCTSKGSLLRHVSHKHDVPKPHTCKECSETFILESLLNRHVFLHHRQELYRCPYCPFESSLQGLHQHLSQCRVAEGNEDRDVGTEVKE